VSYAFKRSVEHLKAEVSLEEYAGELTELKRRGGVLVGLCPLPDHDEKTPSFTIWAGSGTWWCFGCDRGSDILDLHQLLHGYAEKWEALVSLSMERGVELPGRSEGWHEGTRRKAAYHDLRYRVLGDVLKRRMFRVCVLPHVEAIEDAAERDAELSRAWEQWSDGLFWPRYAEWIVEGRRECEPA
jgi:hypothetical protein